MIGNNMNSVVNSVVGGGRFPRIVSLHSGFPLGVSEATDTSHTNSRGPRPNCDPTQMQSFGRQPSVTNGASGDISTSVQLDIRIRRQALSAIARYKDPREGPGYTDTDIGLLKNIHVTESKYLQFRSDFLNAFNNVQLGHPNTNFPSVDFRIGQYFAARKATSSSR